MEVSLSDTPTNLTCHIQNFAISRNYRSLHVVDIVYAFLIPQLLVDWDSKVIIFKHIWFKRHK